MNRQEITLDAVLPEEATALPPWKRGLDMLLILFVAPALLLIGVLVSMFTSIVVTRTFLNLLVPTSIMNHPALFGLPADFAAKASQARRGSKT